MFYFMIVFRCSYEIHFSQLFLDMYYILILQIWVHILWFFSHVYETPFIIFSIAYTN